MLFAFQINSNLCFIGMLGRLFQFSSRVAATRRLCLQQQQQRRLISTIDTTKPIYVKKLSDFETLFDNHNSYSQLANRSVIEVSGPDASEFLQGMQCNHMPLIDQGGAGMLAGFLAPQGRIVADAFIYPHNAGVNFPHPVFLVEIDRRIKERLLKILGFYRLRSKVEIRDVTDEYRVWSVWGPQSAGLVGTEGATLGKVPRGSLVFKEETTSAAANAWLNDTRAPQMGLRMVLENDRRPVLPEGFNEQPSDIYQLRRTLKGIPEGMDDFVPDLSVPLECNLDYMHGVHFNKGCYVGQELTIRTHHRGVVRKRMVPVLLGAKIDGGLCVDPGFLGEEITPQSDIMRKVDAGGGSQNTTSRRANRPAGRLGSTVWNAGLALMRLEHVAQQKTGDDAAKDGWLEIKGQSSTVYARPWSPRWWPPNA